MYLRILTLLLCLSISLSAAETPEAFMDRAAKSMAENETVTAQFTQVKKLKAFRRPLTITGELCIDRTGKFAWHVKTPVQYSCIIRDGKLMQWDAESGKTQTLSLDSNALSGIVPPELFFRQISGNETGFHPHVIPGWHPDNAAERRNARRHVHCGDPIFLYG